MKAWLEKYLSKRFYFIALVILFSLFLLLRVSRIYADPPLKLSWSNWAFSDEGCFAYNARNKVLFGSWNIANWQEYSAMYQFPIQHFLNYIAFAIFGVGFAQARSVSIILSIISLLILWFTFRDILGKSTTLLALFFLGLNYVFIMHNRVAITETPQIFFILIALFFYFKGQKSRLLLFLSGIFGFVAIMAKPYSIPVVIAMFLSFSVKYYRSKNMIGRSNARKFLGVFLSGFALASIVAGLLWYKPNYSKIVYYSTLSRKSVV